MARTTTNKSTNNTNKDVENVQENAKETTQTEIKETAVKTEPRRKFDRYDIVDVYNNTTGKFVYVSPVTKIPYVWEEYGTPIPLEFQEVQYIRSGTKFFQNGWLFIKDQDAIHQLNLQKFLEDTIAPEEVDDFFEMSPKNMETFLERASRGTKSIIAGRAVQLYQSGELDSAKKIKLLENKLNIEIATDEDDE